MFSHVDERFDSERAVNPYVRPPKDPRQARIASNRLVCELSVENLVQIGAFTDLWAPCYYV